MIFFFQKWDTKALYTYENLSECVLRACFVCKFDVYIFFCMKSQTYRYCIHCVYVYVCAVRVYECVCVSVIWVAPHTHTHGATQITDTHTHSLSVYNAYRFSCSDFATQEKEIKKSQVCLTHWYVTWLIDIWHEAHPTCEEVREFVSCNMAAFHDKAHTTHSYVTWLIHMRHDSFICDMTHSYEAHLKVRQRPDHSTHMHIHAMHTVPVGLTLHTKYIYIHRSARIHCRPCAVYTMYTFVCIQCLQCIQCSVCFCAMYIVYTGTAQCIQGILLYIYSAIVGTLGTVYIQESAYNSTVYNTLQYIVGTVYIQNVHTKCIKYIVGTVYIQNVHTKCIKCLQSAYCRHFLVCIQCYCRHFIHFVCIQCLQCIVMYWCTHCIHCAVPIHYNTVMYIQCIYIVGTVYIQNV